MMGVQATCGKRKLDVETTGAGSPCKAARWEVGAATPVTPAGEDCLARLRAVAAVPDCGPWRPAAHHVLTPGVASTPLDEPPDDEDDWDDELSDYEEHAAAPCPGGRQHQWGYWHQHNQQLYQQPPAPPHQTIRREENGKSYLELGPAAATVAAPAVGCYRQRRLAVLNLSMCKLARYRQCSDPSLRRSVLICNTLRRIEREMEREGQQQQQATPPPPPPPAPWYHPAADAPPDYGLRELAAPSGRVTPFPHQHHPADSPDSGYSEDRTINWGSVLSLTAHAGLADEPLNNNLELYHELGLAPPPDPPPADTWDSFVHVLVSGT